MNQEEKGSSEPKPRYIWDPKKLAWVETTEPEVHEPVAEKAAVEPQVEAVVSEARPEEFVEEVKVEAEAQENVAEAEAEIGEVVQPKVEAGGLQYGGAWTRLVALVVDLIVFLVISIIVGQVSGSSILINSVSGTTVTPIFAWQQWLYIGVITVYFVGFWAWRGQTPGKMLTGLKIVKNDGRPIGIGRAVLRYVVFFLYLLLWGFAGTLVYLFAIMIGVLIIIPFNRKKRTIHDFIAGTVVINSRAPKPAPVAVAELVEADEAPETAEHLASDPETEKAE